MVDTENLRTASLYINNQLLSRGLLRDGQDINFANPGKGEADVALTMGQIISVLNDLILRRDRDAEHRESLSATMRNLRAENLKYTNDITRTREKHVEAKRKLDIAEGSEASLKTQLKSADAAVRGLKDEIARTKALVAQARASCATDVRRRDRQIDTLKKQLGEAGRARGSRGNPAVTTISVTGHVAEEKGSPSSTVSMATEDYGLRNETNAFLAELAQNLSEENESLLTMMRGTMERLREMSGWSGNDHEESLVVKQPSFEEMESELESILTHMTTILTNPSFVPIEEVMIREEEIKRLKDGWVKMEGRWREAVHLMDGWRKRMAASGRPVCDEELRMGLRLSPIRIYDVEETRQALGFGLSAVEEEQDDDAPAMLSSPCPPASEPLQLVPADGLLESGAESSTYEDDLPLEDYDVEEPNVQILQQSTAMPSLFQQQLDSSPLPEPPQLSPLRNSATAGNRGSLRNNKIRPKPVDFTTIAEENTWDLTADAAPQPPPHRVRTRSPSRTSLDDALLPKPKPEADQVADNEGAEIPHQLGMNTAHEHSGGSAAQQTPRPSRLPLPRNAEQVPQQSPLTMATIAAKLAASEREADATRVRAKLKAARGTRGLKKPTLAPGQPKPDAPKPSNHEPEHRSAADEDLGLKDRRTNNDDVDPVKQDPTAAEQPEKRKRDRKASKTTSRRRSTLSPWELESLISGNVQ